MFLFDRTEIGAEKRIGMLRFAPGKGRLLTIPGIPPPTGVVGNAPSDIGIVSAVGTVMDSKISHRRGYRSWQCTLAQTHVGRGGCGGSTVDTQLIEIRCLGEWAALGKRVRKGAQLAVAGKILHRPKYVASTTSYDLRSEVLVSDLCGSVTIL